MKYIKTFEKLYRKIKKSDYIKLNYNTNDSDINIFFNTNIGKIDDIIGYNPLWFTVKFESIPDNISDRFEKYKNYYIYRISFNNDDIEEYARTKEELELKLSTNKFNL